MTLHKDDAFLVDKSWLHEWCLDCDQCGTHTHIPPTKDDPRLSDRCDGWKLDIDGLDFCPDCKQQIGESE